MTWIWRVSTTRWRRWQKDPFSRHVIGSICILLHAGVPCGKTSSGSDLMKYCSNSKYASTCFIEGASMQTSVDYTILGWYWTHPRTYFVLPSLRPLGVQTFKWTFQVQTPQVHKSKLVYFGVEKRPFSRFTLWPNGKLMSADATVVADNMAPYVISGDV